MIYDGECGFCKRAMASFLAYDGLNQISVRDYRTNPSPVVASEKVDKALYLVTGDKRAIPGFDAYQYAVLRVPGLWWQEPFFTSLCSVNCLADQSITGFLPIVALYRNVLLSNHNQ